MKDTRKENTRRKRPDKQPPRPRRRAEDERKPEQVPEETQPAEERGERIATGKAISRGGASSGFVPGATEQPPKKDRR
jgi:hypothetical protein